MKLKEKIVDAICEKNVFNEKRADNIMKIVGIEYENLEQIKEKKACR